MPHRLISLYGPNPDRQGAFRRGGRGARTRRSSNTFQKGCEGPSGARRNRRKSAPLSVRRRRAFDGEPWDRCDLLGSLAASIPSAWHRCANSIVSRRHSQPSTLADEGLRLVQPVRHACCVRRRFSGGRRREAAARWPAIPATRFAATDAAPICARTAFPVSDGRPRRGRDTHRNCRSRTARHNR